LRHFDRFISRLAKPIFAGRKRFCSAGDGKFPGFRTRNHRFEDGLFPQEMCGAQPRGRKRKTEVLTMLSWVVTFLVIALIAGILGFGGVAGASIEIAKTIFFIAIILFLVSAVIGLVRGRTRV
jgi:uncharacterized membrane protein YtjA (UPF0391 family)